MSLEQKSKGISKLVKLFMSSNTNFLIFKEDTLNGKPAPNLCDYIIERRKTLDLNIIRNIATDLLLSLQLLHSKGIAHLDLQPNNIIVLEEFDATNAQVAFSSKEASQTQPKQLLQITNFFLSAGFCKKKFSTNKISSFFFMAPERILAELDKSTDQSSWCKCDIWSVGVILFLLTFGKSPFQGENNH